MAKLLFVTTTALKAIVYFILIAMTLSQANSARILDEALPGNPAVVGFPATTAVPAPTTTLSSGQVQATTPTTVENGVADPPLPDETAVPDTAVAAPVADAVTPVEDGTAAVTPPVTVAAPLPAGATTTTTPLSGPAPVVATGATVAKPAGSQITTATTSPPFSFFMHDILGGSHPSNRIVTGIIARTEINGIPFSQPNNNLFPLQGGTPLSSVNNLNNLINPNTAPLLTGLTGTQTNSFLQNTGNNNNVANGNNQPFVTAGNLPAGSALQKLMFGSITVVDNELTEGQELGSAVIGKAQGFYLASSMDGTSHTMAFTVLLHGGGDVEDTISFFGVHRTSTPDSQIAVIGGTGKYDNAKGYATVETLPQVNQHTTDGVDTIMHFNVYLSE
ncbi:hypothetical protein OIU84_019890 [Salix udensis]|uniref:Dirigent protein n=1 Tax=Salix udensis TaxID=889485 RepID=A0AAD6L1Q7_9ROSI|nr:hypothetical protein OIU84_019890 [Salix udensis]